jgi:hypothetical protein
MRQITLRIDDPAMEKMLRRKAKDEGKSLNKVALELIRTGAGHGGRIKNPPRGASLSEFAGVWTEQEAKEFEEAIRIFEEIDGEMWK